MFGFLYGFGVFLMWIFLIGFSLPLIKIAFNIGQSLARYISSKLPVHSGTVRQKAEGIVYYKDQVLDSLDFQGSMEMKDCIVNKLSVHGDVYISDCVIKKLFGWGQVSMENTKLSDSNIMGSIDGRNVNMKDLNVCGSAILKDAWLGSIMMEYKTAEDGFPALKAIARFIRLSQCRVDQDIIIDNDPTSVVIRIDLDSSQVIGKIIAVNGAVVEVFLKDSSCAVGGIEGSVTVTQV